MGIFQYNIILRFTFKIEKTTTSYHRRQCSSLQCRLQLMRPLHTVQQTAVVFLPSSCFAAHCKSTHTVRYSIAVCVSPENLAVDGAKFTLFMRTASKQGVALRCVQYMLKPSQLIIALIYSISELATCHGLYFLRKDKKDSCARIL